MGNGTDKILYSKIHRLKNHLLLIPDHSAPKSTPFLLFQTKLEGLGGEEEPPIPDPIQIP